MKPSIGRTVIVKGFVSNGSDEHPAIVNRAWSESRINVTLFPDCHAPVSLTSVLFVNDREAADKYLMDQSHESAVAFWPERV
jgi:hypothetical protein